MSGMSRWFWLVVAGIVALGIIAVFALLLLPKPLIPPKVVSEATSTVLAPDSSNFKIAHQSIKYDSDLKLLNYNVSAYGKTIIISEQPTPESFTDVPAVYTKVLDGMNDFYDFDVSVGSIHVTTPPQLNGKQAAVLNTKGTLLFAKPSASLSNSEWQQFFTSFTVLQ
jgi:hypothetical protein